MDRDRGLLVEGGSRCWKWWLYEVVCGRAGATKFEQPRTSSLLTMTAVCSLFLFLAPAACLHFCRETVVQTEPQSAVK